MDKGFNEINHETREYEVGDRKKYLEFLRKVTGCTNYEPKSDFITMCINECPVMISFANGKIQLHSSYPDLEKRTSIFDDLEKIFLTNN